MPKKKKAISVFDKKDVYEQEIAPIVKELLRACSINDVPVFVSCCVANSEEKAEYKHEMLAPEVRNLKLSDDLFMKFTAVTLGFETVLKNEIPEDYVDVDTPHPTGFNAFSDDETND